MIFINNENELTWNNKYQALYFYAVWMPFNQKVMYKLNILNEELPFVSIFAIDTDYFKGLCKRFDVTTIPTIIIMENGKEAKRIEGVVHSEEFAAIFDDICTSEPTITGEK